MRHMSSETLFAMRLFFLPMVQEQATSDLHSLQVRYSTNLTQGRQEILLSGFEGLITICKYVCHTAFYVVQLQETTPVTSNTGTNTSTTKASPALNFSRGLCHQFVTSLSLSVGSTYSCIFLLVQFALRNSPYVIISRNRAGSCTEKFSINIKYSAGSHTTVNSSAIHIRSPMSRVLMYLQAFNSNFCGMRRPGFLPISARSQAVRITVYTV